MIGDNNIHPIGKYQFPGDPYPMPAFKWAVRDLNRRTVESGICRTMESARYCYCQAMMRRGAIVPSDVGAIPQGKQTKPAHEIVHRAAKESNGKPMKLSQRLYCGECGHIRVLCACGQPETKPKES